MTGSFTLRTERIVLILFILFIASTPIGLLDTLTWAHSARPALYWCPGGLRRERLLTAPQPGCYPLVEEPAADGAPDRIDLRPPITPQNNAGVVAQFLRSYLGFLACCAANPGSLDLLSELEREASRIHKRQLELLPYILLQTRQGKALILPIVRARHELRELKKRLVEVAEIQATIESLDFESTGRERLRMTEILESIERDFPPPRELIVRAVTGPEIGTPGPSGRTGEEIGIQPAAGPAIGLTPLAGEEIGTTPPTGEETGTTPTGPEIGNSNGKSKP
ncbi:MAG: hypothetical protein EWM72_00766 [Nitrospira sp.]|nr:MAG: hypothetical protein EWM72_00766 [Nitrospira sp.]